MEQFLEINKGKKGLKKAGYYSPFFVSIQSIKAHTTIKNGFI